MRCNSILLLLIFTSLAFGLSKDADAQQYSNFTLPGGAPGFDLTGTSASASQEVVVAFNPKEISVDKSVPWGKKGSNSDSPDLSWTTLDLTDSRIPVLGNPTTGSDFSIFWGMYPTDPGRSSIQFNLNDANGRPIQPVLSGANSFNYGFSASDGTNTFNIFLTVTGASPLDPLSWGMTVPGPPDLPAVQFNFSFQALTSGDPTLSFAVFENGQQLSFAAAVPEPETYAMMLAGLGLLGFTARRRKQQLSA